MDQNNFNFDYNQSQQHRERYNASLDRNRHEFSSSVRSEPATWQGYFGEYEFPQNYNMVSNEQNQLFVQQPIILDEQEYLVENEENVEEIEEEDDEGNMEKDKEREPTTIYCMECDTIIPSTSSTSHDLTSCAQVQTHKFSCSICNQKFNFERNLRVHLIQLHTGKETFEKGMTCNLCPESKRTPFNRSSAYIGHVKMHEKPDTLNCDECMMEFGEERALQKHIRHAHREPNELLYCPRCSMIVPVEESVAHMKVHKVQEKLAEKPPPKGKRKAKERERKFGCDECEKMFVRKYELDRHKVVHDRKNNKNPPKWECLICHKDYAHKSGLLEHKKLAHPTDEQKKKVIACPICGAQFTKNSNKIRHIKSSHPTDQEKTDKMIYDCPDCPMSHKSAGALNIHKRKFHNISMEAPMKKVPFFEKRTCKVCKKEFREVEMMKKHIIQHKYFEKRIRLEKGGAKKCDYCDKSYVLQSSIDWHIQEHFQAELIANDRLPFCRLCNLQFMSQEEFRGHVEVEHPVICEGCQQKFTSRQVFDAHICQQMPLNEQNQLLPYFPSGRVVICRLCKPPQRLVTARQIYEHKAKHAQRRTHLCWACHKSFRTAQLLSLHRENVHERQPIKCTQCEMIFDNRVMLKHHMTHMHRTGELDYQCMVHADRDAAQSAQSFADYGHEIGDPGPSARAHSVNEWMEPEPRQLMVQQVTINSPIRCEICRHQYNSIELLCEHWSRNDSDRDHSFSLVACPVCEKKCQGAAEAAEHLKYEHNIGRERQDLFMENYQQIEKSTTTATVVPRKQGTIVHTCEECSKSFKKKCDLTRHMRTHTGEKPFECTVCNLKFALASVLKTHMERHSGLGPQHVCTVCSHLFYSLKSLRIHMRIHSNDHPVKCRHCHEGFRTSGMLKTHIKRCHPEHAKPTENRNAYLTTYTRESDINRTIQQISSMPDAPLRSSRNSAFDRVIPNANMIGNMIFWLITKLITPNMEYTVVAQAYPPAPETLREGIDTQSEINVNEQLQNGQNLSIVLHNGMRLHVNGQLMLHNLPGPQTILKVRVRVGEYTNGDLFQIVGVEDRRFVMRCDVCEVDLMNKEQSDEHFASEDHETAMLMHPMVLADQQMQQIHRNDQFNQNMDDRNRTNLTDCTCKQCNQRFFGMDQLLDHIRKEHLQQAGDSNIPARPVAHTAPIH